MKNLNSQNSQFLDSRNLEELLQLRADNLANKALKSEKTEKEIEIIIFRIQDEVFGLELQYIMEVITFPRVNPAPGISSALQGVFHYRGEIIPIFLLRSVLDHDFGGYCPTDRCIVLGINEVHFAFAVDSIYPPQTIKESLLTDSKYTSANQKHSFISCVTAEGIIVLDGHVLLNDTSLIIDCNEA